jgi:hypothetical protein
MDIPVENHPRLELICTRKQFLGDDVDNPVDEIIDAEGLESSSSWMLS